MATFGARGRKGLAKGQEDVIAPTIYGSGLVRNVYFPTPERRSRGWITRQASWRILYFQSKYLKSNLDGHRRGGLQHPEVQSIAPSRQVVSVVAFFLALELGTSGLMLGFSASSLHVMLALGDGHYILLEV